MKSKAFTLIELLVVISIIGVIASIVLVSFSGSRDKAKLAKSQQFSANINHSLGAYAVGIWDFEDQNNPTADRSGFGNHGILYGNTHFVANDVLGGYALIFDGVDDYVDCGNNPSLNITDAITIEAWVKGKSDHGKIVEKGKGGYADGDYSLQGSAFKLYVDNLGYPGGYMSLGYSYAEDVWNHVAATYDGTYMRVYVNGAEKANRNIGSHTIDTSGLYLGIGRKVTNPPNWYPFNGTIDDVRIYNHALSAAQIQQHYALGAAKHGIALK